MACAWVAAGTAQAATATERVIHTFGNFPKGANPYGRLTRDSSGNLYGTTCQGGAANMGVVFRLNASGYTVLHSFKGGTDGANPYAGVTLDSAGNLYGTTLNGGVADAGVVYKLEPAGLETVLYSFTGGSDGYKPYAGVILDPAGNLYGTTYEGGPGGGGVVYKVSPSGQETVLYGFTGKADGGQLYAGVIADEAGNLYGTAYSGGRLNAGVIYKLDASGHETVLHSFTGSSDTGGGPYAGVIRDAAGNLYGTTSRGGGVYKLDAAGNYTVLYMFWIGFMPSKAEGDLIRDASGNLYGTTQYGGKANAGAVYELDSAGKLKGLYSFPGGGHDLPSGPTPGVIRDAADNLYGVTAYAGVGGMVYKLDPSRKETTLYRFLAAAGGTNPSSGLIRDEAGNLYGTTYEGGAANQGVVYKVDAVGHETVLHSFTGGADGAGPRSVIRDSAGNLYGTTVHGGIASGSAGYGVVYKIDTSGHQTVLHAFTGAGDGGLPNGVVRDSAGDLYGTAFLGGAAGLGVVFKVDPSGQETVLHSFTGAADGASPDAGVVLDSAGNLYGTTFYGGTANVGVVYTLDASGQERVLHSFTGFGAGGGNPIAGVFRDYTGNLYGTTVNYGTTSTGGSGGGVVFELSAAGDYTVLYTFTGGADGGMPFLGVVRDTGGNLYGASSTNSGRGVVYELRLSGQFTVLHTFTGGVAAILMLDPARDIYGTAGGGPSGGGLLFNLTLP